MRWTLAENPFEVLTRRRFTGMDVLLADHLSKCGLEAAKRPTDAELSTIHQRAMAARTAWNVAYLRWTVSRRTHKGRTFAVNQLVSQLRGRQIGLWQVMVQQTDLANRTWLKGSLAFSDLFPQGRRPFQQGAIEARQGALCDLASALEVHPALTDIALLVRAFHTELATALTLQREAQAAMMQASAELEKQRKTAAGALYRNMARLMEKYADNPAVIWNFFERKLISKRPAEKAS
ncbi:MAG TPA: hypothetical protein VG796_08140 [Verrucomicrobiales bacterium]|nr:hypothetical protein [Verrucomicrobiales bacterium]